MVRGESAAASPDDELEELERKYQALEGDRRSFFETSRWTIKQNRDTLATAKRENKELRLQLLTRGSLKASGNSDADDLAKLTQQVTEQRKKYDDLKQLSLRRQQQLKQRLDNVKELAMASVKPDEAEDPGMRNVRLLENRVDKAQMKYNEAAAIHKTYSLIAKRLREERIGFNNQLQALERTLRAKEIDLQELVLLSHEATHAKETSKVELTNVDSQLAQERASRERDLTDRRAHVRAIEEAQMEQERRDREAAEAAAARAAAEAESNMQKRGADANKNADGGERFREEEERRLAAYEEAFRRIKEATGVSDVSEVITKFLTSEDTSASLTVLTKEAQARIDALLAEREEAKMAVEKARYAGTAAAAEKTAVGDLETGLVEERLSQEKLKHRAERMNKMLLAIRAGVNHLAGKLDSFKVREEDTMEGRVSITTDALPPAVADEDVVISTFRACESKLLRALEALADEEGATATALSDPAHLAAMTFLALDEVELKPGNLRVGSRPYASDEEEDGDENDGGDGGDDVLDRDTVKQSANQLQHKGMKGGKFRKEPGA